MKTMIITASSNEKLKHLRALYKDKKLREENGVYVAEGVNFVKDIPLDNRVIELYIRENSYENLQYLEKQFGIEAYLVKDNIFDALAGTVTPSGVIAVLKRQEVVATLGDFVLVLDGISDAGNMGTILRTAYARGIRSVICIGTVDPYSPKAVRASMGGINNINIVSCDTNYALKLLACYDIVSLATGSESFYDYKKSGKTALVVGSEAHGISEQIINASKTILTIPMARNSVESLNAAVSAAVAMYLIR